MKQQNQKGKFNYLSKLKFIILIAFMAIVWALAFPFIKIGLEELTFVNLTIMRFFIACIILIIILTIKSRKFSKFHKKDIIPIFLLGFFGVMVYHFSLNYGEQYISPGAASLIIATIPIFIIILATTFLKERISFKKLLGIVIALSGVVIISIWGSPDAVIEINYIFGAIGALIAAIMGAVYTVAGKKLLDRYSALSLTVYAMLLGSVGLIPFIRISLFNQVATMSTTTWFVVIFLGMFSTVIAYLIWYMALEIKTASDLSVYLYAVPVLATISSYYILGDELTLFFVLGGVLVIIGLIIVNLKKK